MRFRHLQKVKLASEECRDVCPFPSQKSYGTGIVVVIGLICGYMIWQALK